MVRIHNKLEWADHKKETFRPSNEKIKLEIFSYDHQYTKTFLPASTNIRGSNRVKVNHRSLKCYESKDKLTSFTLEFLFNIKSRGEYRIDILYENKNAKDFIGEYNFVQRSKKSSKLYANASNIKAYVNKVNELNKRVKSVRALIQKETTEMHKQEEQKAPKGVINNHKKIIAKYESSLTATQKLIERYESKIEREHKMVGGTELKFDGELNITKRKTLFHNVNEKGVYAFSLELPANCYFLGLAVRKVLTFTGDNLDSAGTNLMFTEATISKSGEVKPAEASFQIGYSDEYECDLTRTGFYFDYLDEVNIYVKENNNVNNNSMVRRFGGYLSTISHDNNKTNITINCADRLIDGEAKYILDAMLIQKGTASETEIEYNKPLNFNNYGQALKYLCDIHEITLKSNIRKNYLVDGEKYNKGISIRFGKKKDIKDKKKLKAKNCTVKINNNSITVRNGASGIKPQYIMLYNAKDYSKKPIRLKHIENGEIEENNLTFHMTYGLGDPAKSSQSSSTDQITTDGSAGNYGKCGVSSDKKTVMSIAKPSSGRNEGLSESQWYKVVFKNYCPECKESGTLRYDSGTEKTNCITCGHYNGSKRTWGDISEGEVSCNSCCADYCGATGWEKDGGLSSRLTTAVKPVESSQAERDKLLDGQMSGAGAVKVSADNIFKVITQEAFKYTYQLFGETYQTYSQMKKHGKGDCWAFSDLIFTMMKKFGVKCKIVEYPTDQSNAHRSVRYMNKKGQWVDFPYREYGWGERFNNNLNNTSRSATAGYIKINNAGKSIDQAKGTISDTTKTTTTVTTTTGYDKNNPYQAYIEVTYSTKQQWKTNKKKINITFTQKAGTNNDITGLPNYWINNAQRQVSVDMKGWFEDNEPNKDIFLHSIRFVTPALQSANIESTSADTGDGKKAWYTYDKSTHDEASCKMDLFTIIFDDRNAINPTDLGSCGKTVNSMMEEIVTAAQYKVHINYAKHRCDDKIIFSVDNQKKAKFLVTEGDDNNVLEWSNISCSPVSVLRNTSVCVYKDSKNKYQYVDTRNARSMLLYNEQTTLETNSEVSGSKQAYFLARNNKEFNPEFDYTYTVVIPYAPNLQLKDAIEVIANRKYLNDIKPVESIQVKYDHKTKPIIQTTLGLGEIEPYLRIKKEMQKLRSKNKKKTTFSTSATPIEDETVYHWDN